MAFHPDPSLEAFLHIVHISDLHCKSPAAPIDFKTELAVRRVVRLLRLMGRSQMADDLETFFQDGLAGHDPTAHTLMCDFLSDFVKNPDFAQVPTLLLATGDLSSLGDSYSITMALDWLKDYKRILKPIHSLELHGNHDAWPGMQPLLASDSDLKAHQVRLRSLLGNRQWPNDPIAIPIPHSRSRLLLSALNSTTGNRSLNWRARGDVADDPPWPEVNGLHQLSILAGKIQQGFDPDPYVRDFRILAIHHPIHYPPPRPMMKMSLKNDRVVADTLAHFSQQHQRGLLAHLVLSGHTHKTYPPLGLLPTTATGQQYDPLYEGQLQLIAGSYSHLPRTADFAEGEPEDAVPQQCEILTFFNSNDYASRGQLLMERRIVGRPPGGRYGFLPLPGRPETIEHVLWEY